MPRQQYLFAETRTAVGGGKRKQTPPPTTRGGGFSYVYVTSESRGKPRRASCACLPEKNKWFLEGHRQRLNDYKQSSLRLLPSGITEKHEACVHWLGIIDTSRTSDEQKPSPAFGLKACCGGGGAHMLTRTPNTTTLARRRRKACTSMYVHPT